jgi:hypothetical protein
VFSDVNKHVDWTSIHPTKDEDPGKQVDFPLQSTTASIFSFLFCPNDALGHHPMIIAHSITSVHFAVLEEDNNSRPRVTNIRVLHLVGSEQRFAHLHRKFAQL